MRELYFSAKRTSIKKSLLSTKNMRFFNTSVTLKKTSTDINHLFEIIENPNQLNTQSSIMEFFDQHKVVTINSKANIKDGYTPLHTAAKQNNTKAIALLLDSHKSSIDEKNELTQETALHIAARYQSEESMLELIKRGADQNQRASINLSIPLFAKNFLDKNVEFTPLEVACIVGFTAGVKLLLREDSRIKNVATTTQADLSNVRNLLICAVASQQTKVLNTLLNTPRLKAIFEANQAELNYVLNFAAYINNIEAINTLHHHGASIRNYTKFENALHLAISQGNIEAIETLIDLDKEILRITTTQYRTVDNHDLTPVTLAAKLLRETNKKLELEKEKIKENYVKGIINYQTQQEIERSLARCYDEKINKYSKVYRLISNVQAQINANEFMPINHTKIRIKNLVFKGGGPRGIAYIGALNALEEKLREQNKDLSQIQRVAGTSAGAITAVLLSVGYTPKEMEKILMEDDLQTFLDTGFKDSLNIIKGKDGFSGKIKSASWEILKLTKNYISGDKNSLTPMNFIAEFYQDQGLCDGNVFREWVENLIKHKTNKENLTFGELNNLVKENPGQYKHLHVVTTDLINKKIVVLSSEDKTVEDVIISDSVRSSMSIPLLFKPHGYYIKRNNKREELTQKTERYKLVDGGLICNYPIDLFDYAKYQYNGLLPEQENALIGNNPETLGFELEEVEIKSEVAINNAVSLSKQIARIYWESEKLIATRRGIYEGRTIKIDPRGVGLLDFDLSPKKQNELMESGKDSVKLFFNENDFGVTEKKSLRL